MNHSGPRRKSGKLKEISGAMKKESAYFPWKSASSALAIIPFLISQLRERLSSLTQLNESCHFIVTAASPRGTNPNGLLRAKNRQTSGVKAMFLALLRHAT